jgi:hypothetical protein
MAEGEDRRSDIMITLDNYRETKFEAVEAAWLDGSLDVDTFTQIAQEVRAVTYRCTYPGAGAPNWSRYPASLLECSTLSPNRLDEMLRMGTVSESLHDQYRQWWRLATPRLSSVWDDTEAMPVHPRVQEMLDRTMRVGAQREKDNISASAEMRRMAKAAP